MFIKKVAILFPLFIFGIMTQVWADSVNSLNSPVNQETIMKMDENKGALQKKKSHAKEPVNSSKKDQARSQSGMQQADDAVMMSRSQIDINFLKAVKAKKKSLLTDFLDKVIFSYDFAQNGWRNRFPSFMGVAEAKSSDPDVSQTVLGSYPTGSRHLEEGRILETFKLPQFKRENISKEIFMGFRFSFYPVSGYVFLEMNAIPSEKRPGLMIPF
jgi:hypothetical protein